MNASTRYIALAAAALAFSLSAYACGTEDDGMEVRPGLLMESAAAQSSEACLDASGVLDDSVKKVTICHIPPGNPENAHTITISRHAFHTHQDHHNDYLGDCGCGDDDDPDRTATPVEPPAPVTDQPTEPAPGDDGDTPPPNTGTTDAGSSDTPPDPTPSETCAEDDACVVHADCADNQACASGCCLYVML